MDKRQNWETKFSEFIEQYAQKKFKRGQDDCVMFAMKAVIIIYGIDFGSQYLNTYRNKKEANEVLSKLGTNNIEELTVSFLGPPIKNINYASRGDVVLIKYKKDYALGIIDLSGQKAVTMGKNGLDFYPRQFWQNVWKVKYNGN